MHKLKGCAGTLGAKTIHLLAGEAEVACAAGEIRRAAHLASTLGPQLKRLRQCAAHALMDIPLKTDDTALPDGGNLGSQIVTDLVVLLRRQSLSATERFGSISPQLQRLLGADSYELVRSHMEHLQYTDAADALEACQR